MRLPAASMISVTPFVQPGTVSNMHRLFSIMGTSLGDSKTGSYDYQSAVKQ